MRTNLQKASAGVTRYSRNEKGQQARTMEKTGYAAYHGIDDFLRNNPIAAANRYGDRVISGTRIC